MSIANKALAVLAALALFLPLITFSISARNPVVDVKQDIFLNISGAKVIQCYLSPCSAKDILSSGSGILGQRAQNIPDSASRETFKLSDRNAPDTGINLFLFAAIALVIAAITILIPARTAELLSGVASVGAIVLLFLFRSKIVDLLSGDLLGSPGMSVFTMSLIFDWQFGIGFWACAVLSGLSAILAFKGNLSRQSAVGAEMPGSVSV